MLDGPITSALLLIGVIGGVAGLLAGVLAGARRLMGTVLMGVLGAIAVAAIARIAGAPTIYAVGDGFSVVWGAGGALVLAYVVGRSDRA